VVFQGPEPSRSAPRRGISNIFSNWEAGTPHRECDTRHFVGAGMRIQEFSPFPRGWGVACASTRCLYRAVRNAGALGVDALLVFRSTVASRDDRSGASQRHLRSMDCGFVATSACCWPPTTSCPILDCAGQPRNQMPCGDVGRSGRVTVRCLMESARPGVDVLLA